MILIHEKFERFKPYIEFASNMIRKHWNLDICILYGVKDFTTCDGFPRLVVIPSEKIFGENFLKRISLPEDVEYLEIHGEKLPVIFSKSPPFIETHDRNVVTNVDIVETYFYFLSLYEEMVIDKRDRYGRFPEEISFLKVSGLYRIPVLDITRKVFLDMIKSNQISLDIGNSGIVMTHDVDRLVTRYSLRHTIKLMLKGNIESAFLYVKDHFTRPIERSFLRLIESDNLRGRKPIVYFMVKKGNILRPDADYGPKGLRKALNTLKQSGLKFHIGLHPSLKVETLNDMLKEKRLLETIYGGEVIHVRMHYLRYDPRFTFDMFERAGFKYDSSVGFPSGFGYRLGTAYILNVFNWKTLKKGILEIPLVLMDNDENICLENLITAFRNVDRYGGEPAVNVHSDFYLKCPRGLARGELNG